jgi:hypothetical protein
MTETLPLPPNPSVGRLLLGSGPRFVRDALAPVLVFYAGWKLYGLTPAIVAATGLALLFALWAMRGLRAAERAGAA